MGEHRCHAECLEQNWMRDYDPTTGRYIQADPLGLVDGASVYGYARQSPGVYTDPTGQCPICAVAVPVGIEIAKQGAKNAIKRVAQYLISSAIKGKVFAVPAGELSREKKVERARERKHYKTYCSNGPKPTGDLCTDLKNQLDHAKECLRLREEFGERWYGDNNHEVENSSWKNRIRNKEDDIREFCPQFCPDL